MHVNVHVADVKMEYAQKRTRNDARKYIMPCASGARLFLLLAHDENMGSLQQAVSR